MEKDDNSFNKFKLSIDVTNTISIIYFNNHLKKKKKKKKKKNYNIKLKFIDYHLLMVEYDVWNRFRFIILIAMVLMVMVMQNGD